MILLGYSVFNILIMCAPLGTIYNLLLEDKLVLFNATVKINLINSCLILEHINSL